MKFFSIFTIDPSTMAGPPGEKIMADMNSLIAELIASGKLVDTGGRAPTGTSLRIERANGNVRVTDGPFTESKEIVGGFAVFNVESKDEVIALTRRFLEVVGSGTCQLFEVSEMPEHLHK
jgi:hypothetical protein